MCSDAHAVSTSLRAFAIVDLDLDTVSSLMSSLMLVRVTVAPPGRGAVIFLRATHADLTKAGYVDLDPQHELFLLYREKDDEEPFPDVSILSPRYGHAVGPSLHRTVGGEVRVVGATPLKVRQGVALTSKVVGVLSPGTRLRVTDSRVWRRDATHRVLVAAADTTEDGAASARQILPLGWVTASYLTPAGEAEP